MPQAPYSVEIVGPGDPVVTVFVGVHGDEAAPVRGVRRLLRELPDGALVRAFRMVICNVRAAAIRRRYVDCDLNRAFPGNPDSERHEERLANALRTELPPTTVNIDLHSTSFQVPPYGIIHSDDPDDICRLRVTPVRNYVLVNERSLISCLPGAQAFEVGYDRDPRSELTAALITREVLQGVGCLVTETPSSVPDVRVHQIVGVLKKSDFVKLSSELRDFEPVSEGQHLGIARDGSPARAERAFIPIWVNDPVAIRVCAPSAPYTWRAGSLARADT